MPVNEFRVQDLKKLCVSTDLVFKVGNVVPVSGFSVQNLETLSLSADLVFRIWKRCACQRIWCSKFENAAFLGEFGVRGLETPMRVNGFRVPSLETLCLSADLATSPDSEHHIG